MSIIHVENEEQFKKEVLEAKNPIILDFYADWCPPCRDLGKVFESVIEESNGWNIVKLNCDKPGNKVLAQNHQVTGIPAVFFYHNGKQEKEYNFTGYNKAALQKAIEHAAKLVK